MRLQKWNTTKTQRLQECNKTKIQKIQTNKVTKGQGNQLYHWEQYEKLTRESKCTQRKTRLTTFSTHINIYSHTTLGKIMKNRLLNEG